MESAENNKIFKSDFWVRAYASLQGPFWTHKGLSANCPFCHAESTSNKQKFLIFFNDGNFKHYLCFVCGANGGGIGGLSRLGAALGLSSHSVEEVLDIASASNSNPFSADSSLFKSPFGSSEDTEPESPIEYDLAWPPAWIHESEDVVKNGIAYLESRGIKDVPTKIIDHNLYFSERIEVLSKVSRNIKDYPCVLAPMLAKHPEDKDSLSVVGFTSRYLGTPKSTDPKSIAMGGNGWKNVALFGMEAIDPLKPVAVVEGLFSALSTPNSLATGGKKIARGQLELIASLKAKIIVFALDPDVKRSTVASYVDQITLMAPNSLVLAVDWNEVGGTGDPNDRGEDAMRAIIAQTISKALGQKF